MYLDLEFDVNYFPFWFVLLFLWTLNDLPQVLVKKLIGYQPFFSWIDENHNVISCFILLVKIAKFMLIWLPCVVMKTCHEKGITFNERMTNWGFGTLKWTTATSSTRHLNSSKNFYHICIQNHVNFNQLCEWCDLCHIYLLISAFQFVTNFLQSF